MKMILISGFGNPLLDINVGISDDVIIKKYNLEKNGQKEINNMELQHLLKDIKRYTIHLSPGGCTQNTLRVLQWLLGSLKSTYMFGSIGVDDQGIKLKQLLKQSGVHTRYFENKNLPTGTCIALTRGKDRSLCAHLGAAQHYNIDNLKQCENYEILGNSTFIYLEGFFITNRADISKYLLQYSKENDKMFVFNLSGVYLFDIEPENMIYFAKHSNILFGNKVEFLRLGEVLQLENIEVYKIAVELCSFANDSKKLVIITDGSKNVICVHGNGKIEEYEVPSLPKNEIGDTTGAGDAFVSGFLFALYNNKSTEIALKWGCWTAMQIIKQIGCGIPKFSSNGILNIK